MVLSARQPQDSTTALRVGVVLPAYNESAHIASVLTTIPSWVDRIFVVDDASTDTTATVAESVADARVTVIRREHNGGVGAAMVTGYQAALETDVDVVVKMDADGQMHPEDLERLVTPLVSGVGDYAKGNRFYFPNATADMPRVRGVGNALLSIFTKLASGYWHMFDSQCGYTAIRTPFLRVIDLDRIAPDYFFENDMLIALNAYNARVIDVPVATIYGSETSHVNVRRVALSFPPRLMRAGTRRFWRKYLLTDFGVIAVLTLTGATLSGFGAIFGAYHWIASTVSGEPATTGTVMVAVAPLILGVQLILQALSLSVASSPGARESAEYVRSLIADGTIK